MAKKRKSEFSLTMPEIHERIGDMLNFTISVIDEGDHLYSRGELEEIDRATKALQTAYASFSIFFLRRETPGGYWPASGVPRE